MEFISFNAELGCCNALFKKFFDNIKIERTNNKGQKSLLNVACTFGQRSRILKTMENPDNKAEYKVPMIVINRTGYSRQSDRLNNLHNEVKYEISEKRRNYQFLTPVPIDVNYEVSVIAKYPADIDKIASNFMVFFNSNICCSQAHPKFSDIKLNNQVIMSDSVSEDHSDELDNTRDDLIISTFTFTFKTYLFGGTVQYNKKRIKKPVVNLSTFISAVPYEFKNDNEVLDFLKNENHAPLSTILESEITTEVTSYIEDSNEEYDDGIPKIRGLDFGFYTIPKKEDILNYMLSVDNEDITKHNHIYPSSYISSEQYHGPIYETITDPNNNEQRIKPLPLSTSGDYYDVIDNYCTLAPYVDRIYWKIDGASEYKYPNNVKSFSGCETQFPNG